MRYIEQYQQNIPHKKQLKLIMQLFLIPQAHTGVNVESTLKACYIGTLAASSPLTQRRKNSTIMRNAAKLRTDATLAVPKTIMIGKLYNYINL